MTQIGLSSVWPSLRMAMGAMGTHHDPGTSSKMPDEGGPESTGRLGRAGGVDEGPQK